MEGPIQFTNESEMPIPMSGHFGDGNTSTDVNPTHTYPDYGQYSVTLSATGTAVRMSSPTTLRYKSQPC